MWRPGDYFKIGFYGGLGFFVAGLVFLILYWMFIALSCAAIIGVGASANANKSAQTSAPKRTMNEVSVKDMQAMINSSTKVEDLQSAGYQLLLSSEGQWDLPCKDGTLRLVVDRSGRVTGTSVR